MDGISRLLAREGYQILRLDSGSSGKEDSITEPSGNNPMICKDLGELLDRLEKPRCVWLMEKSDERLEQRIRELIPALDEGDVIVDLCDSYFLDTERRACAIQSRGILFLGVSSTALSTDPTDRPGLMVGGDPRAFTAIKPLFHSLAGHTDGGEACANFIGPRGAGHFAGMLCAGLQRCEYALFLEACGLLREFDVDGFPGALDQWKKQDPGFLILKAARAVKGEDRANRIIHDAQTRHDGFEADPRVLEHARNLKTSFSLFSDLSGLSTDRSRSGRNDGSPELVEDLWTVLHASRTALWMQCMDFFEAASMEFNYFLNTKALLDIWHERTWLRSTLLRDISGLYGAPQVPDGFMNALNRSIVQPGAIRAWKRLSQATEKAGLSCPGMAAAMNVIDP